MAGASIELTIPELQEITAFALACAEPPLSIFERDLPADSRPREALEEARRFTAGSKRRQALRVTAREAHRAARAAAERGRAAAGDAARATGHAAASPICIRRQGRSGHPHPGGRGACARALELDAGGDPEVGAGFVGRAVELARPTMVDVLDRYPPARPGEVESDN